MARTIGLLLLSAWMTGCACGQAAPAAKTVKTVCNPMDISYRFMLDEPSRREAADPTMIRFKDQYYLFASKSGGYWYSGDLVDWTFVPTSEIPVEDYAPTAVAIDDTIYFLASGNTIYKSVDLKAGKWQVAAKLPFSVIDPALFLDDDKRLYYYWGCSDKNPTYGVELDYKNNFAPVGKPVSLVFANPNEYGWEVPGDYNTQYKDAPWIEGSWLNKFNGKYYLQYAGPGTQFKSYSDSVYLSDKPLGPYTLATHNPFAYKPEGFAAGAGHGSTFTDNFGNIWHIGTITISVKHMFERRLGLYPVFLDADGILYADTRFGDYPIIIPQKKIAGFDDIFPGWMLLSYGKKVTVSSSEDSHPADLMTDENIRTYWSAQSGKDTEWAMLDLGENYDIYAVQVNFAEHKTNVFGRKENLCFQYSVEYSADNQAWKVLIDKSGNKTDNSHAYTQLQQPCKARFLRIKNVKLPTGNLAISDFRVFGKGHGDKPAAVNQWNVTRKPDNKRTAQLTWEKSQNATGYNIRFGSDVNKLYHTYMVYQDNSISINSLNAKQEYYFTIEAFNENGITATGIVKKAQ